MVRIVEVTGCPRFAANPLWLPVCLIRWWRPSGEQTMLRTKYRVDLAVLEIQLPTCLVRFDQKPEPLAFGGFKTPFGKTAKQLFEISLFDLAVHHDISAGISFWTHSMSHRRARNKI